MSDQILLALKGVESKLTSCDLEQRVLADRLTQIEQKGALLTGERLDKNGSSLGDIFLKQFDANRELFDKTRSVRLELKAATDAITTSSGRTIAAGGAGAPGGGVLGLQNALPTRATGGTTAVEYSRYTGQEGAAAQQAVEGDAKAAVKPTHSLITQTGLTIAGYSKMSKQALNDSSELKRSVDITLNRSVGAALDVALVSGATGFAGGFETLATASTSLIYTGLVDAISEGVSVMQVAGFNPNVVALNPADWLAIVVAKGSDLHYLSGAYLGAMPSEMRGLHVTLSPSVDAGKALLMDSAHSELLIVDNFSVQIGYENDDFTNNLVTILGETRVIPIFRTTGSARLITPKA